MVIVRITSGSIKNFTGFTLIELIVTIVISSILALVLPNFIRQPMENYFDSVARAELTELADQSLRFLARDVRASIPNTMRVSGGNAIEFVQAAQGARYRAVGGNNTPVGGANHNGAADRLTFTASGDNQFNILGRFSNLGVNYGDNFPSSMRIVVYNTNVATFYANAQANSDPGVITPSTTTITLTNDTDEDHLQLSARHQFPFPSSSNRLYVTSGPVSYICDSAAGTLTKYWGYNITSAQPTNPAVAPLSTANSALVSNKINSCNFIYQSGVSQRMALLITSIVLRRSDASADPSQPEQIRLLHQIHVPNTP